MTEREAELLKRLRRLEGVVEELSGQVEVEGIKHSPESDQSSSMQKDSSDSAADVGKVRVVGMDEGSGTTKNWITRSFNLGAGPPKPTFKMESALGRLTLDEGKSRYVSNPFWASITEVCGTNVVCSFSDKVSNRKSRKFGRSWKVKTTSPMKNFQQGHQML